VVSFFPSDLSDPQGCHNLIRQASARHGKVDILVNNAGIQYTSPIEQFPVERWDAIIALNLSAVFHCTAAVLPLMKKARYGRIINLSSTHGLVASVLKSAYVAAKHGVIGLTKVTALETAGQGITCNAICPGWTQTPLSEKQIDDYAAKIGRDRAEVAREMLAEKQPSEQYVMPEQLGAAAVFLASSAAAQMTGAQMTMDGGWTAR
jgi:3-hydroxybutyrate dehydrogenase